MYRFRKPYRNLFAGCRLAHAATEIIIGSGTPCVPAYQAAAAAFFKKANRY
jgi:hypothetical protein